MTTSSKRRSGLFRFLGKLLLQDFIVPTKRLILLILLAVVLSGISFALQLGSLLFWSCNALLLLFSVIDLVLLPKRKEWSVQRILPERVDVNQPFEVKLQLKLTRPQLLRVELNDDLPAEFEGSAGGLKWGTQAGMVQAPDGDFAGGQMLAGGRFDGDSAEFSYSTKSSERGLYQLRNVFLRYYGVIGLWKKQIRLEQSNAIEIYPDLSGVRGVLASVQNALILDGSRLYKKQRSGSDFHYIRDYAQGDDPRHINWKASARTAKLMTNMFQPEKGKLLTLLLDCGRMMGIELEGQVKLDRALEAALTLAAVALKQGDQVALLAYSTEVKVYVPPGRGLSHLQELTRAVYDLKSDFVESAYGVALSYLLRVQKKRSLIVLFSDMESYLNDQELLPYLSRLRRSNYLLLLSLQDPLLHEWARIHADSSRTAFIQSLAHKFTTDRKAYVHTMAGMGIPVLDVSADQLTLSAVNTYLELKAREAL
ncbi:DUF58 domain-containing protein [Paenibacillus eucommiae]|uniref:Uncharacterized protein (DUF58 family) n=1 Tax=Paenibacillus eucommiae TaxID=1355755 RepID=A0ABS4ITK2_9BACL|nr:DUF58 domain-containing protein [Paenibacillus eucommiae]MBP1990894.1 uncharacterized protein (DUF58 family) [Paenibacillus eucommiae]